MRDAHNRLTCLVGLASSFASDFVAHGTFPITRHSNDLTIEGEVLVGSRERRPGLVLAFPVLDRGSGPREHDVFVVDVLCENLAGVD